MTDNPESCCKKMEENQSGLQKGHDERKQKTVASPHMGQGSSIVFRPLYHT